MVMIIPWTASDEHFGKSSSVNRCHDECYDHVELLSSHWFRSFHKLGGA